MNEIEINNGYDGATNRITEMVGYTVTLILNKNISATIEIDSCKEMTIEEIKEEIENQLTKQHHKQQATTYIGG